MPNYEKRSPRKTFEKKLIKICSQLDLSNKKTLEYRDRLGSLRTMLIEISSLWVAGSFARGAPECGDLDLVIQYQDVNGRSVSAHFVAKVFFGRLPLVRFYQGTPQENSSGVPFPEAVKIWAKPGSDWRKQLESIEINPNAGRAPRETDSIPFRDEQILNPDWMKFVAGMIDDGLLESEFFPFDNEILRPLSDDEHRMSKRWEHVKLGKKSLEVLPAVVRLMKNIEPAGKWFGLSAKDLKCGGSLVRIGRPHLNPACLFNASPTRQLVLVPHLSCRGPNGAWVIRRGPKHDDHANFVNKYAFTSDAGCVLASTYSGRASYMLLELFSTMCGAQEATRHWEDSERAVQVDSQKLLELMCCADVIEIDGTAFAVNSLGQKCLQENDDEEIYQSNLHDLITALPTQPNSLVQDTSI